MRCRLVRCVAFLAAPVSSLPSASKNDQSSTKSPAAASNDDVRRKVSWYLSSLSARTAFISWMILSGHVSGAGSRKNNLISMGSAEAGVASSLPKW